MKLLLPVCSRALRSLVGVILVLASAHCASAQPRSYVAPTFSQGLPSPGQASRFPASPLAGGPAAAHGDQFVDVQGNPIVMQAGYCASCNGGGCADCSVGGRMREGYSDPMAVDFGGYSQPDQSGPHYFDISAGFVYMRGEDMFEGLQPFTARGAGGTDLRLDPVGLSDQYKPGWQIAARIDFGPLSVLEATYMGIYDLGFEGRATAPGNTPFSLTTLFSGYGIGDLTQGFDQGEFHRLKYDSDLQSTELSYRRYWVGNNPRASGTWLIGARYIRLTEDLQFDGRGTVNGTTQSSTRIWRGENDMVGLQVGGDGWYTIRQGLRVGYEGKTGIYNNRYQFTHRADFFDMAANAVFINPKTDFDVTDDGNQVAMAAEGGVQVVIDILPSWSVTGGYRALYMSSLATVGNNVDPTAIDSVVIQTQADAFYHGFHANVEWIW